MFISNLLNQLDAVVINIKVIVFAKVVVIVRDQEVCSRKGNI